MSALPARDPARSPRLSAAVLSYDGRHLLEVILPSLAAQRYRDFEVVVVDNGSRDDTVAWLAENWPEVAVRSLPENVGVTPALNVCAAAGEGELVAIFNNDLELHPDCLSELVDALDAHPGAGWAGGKQMNYHRRDEIDGAGDVFTWRGAGHRRGHGERDRGQYDEPTAIFGACGGAALYRRSALEAVGPFDEAFHAFYEDIDWDFRAQLLGLSCRYVPGAVVFHMGSATIGQGLTDFTRYHLWRNTLWVLAKDAPARLLVRHLPEIALGQAMNFAVAVRDRKLGVWARAWRDALGDPSQLWRRRTAVQRRRRADDRRVESAIGRMDRAHENSRS
jgi:GT2 family glycosyltransferase